MTSAREVEGEELAEHSPSAASGLQRQRIRRKPPSKRSAVNEFQARAFALLIDALERASLRYFQASGRHRLPTERHEEFFALPEYRLFVEGTYACGFVCRDFAPGGPPIGRGDRVEDAVCSWTFFELRHHVHTLMRAERWADGYSSPIFESMAQGVLSAIARRLIDDASLYEEF